MGTQCDVQLQVQLERILVLPEWGQHGGMLDVRRKVSGDECFLCFLILLLQY